MNLVRYRDQEQISLIRCVFYLGQTEGVTIDDEVATFRRTAREARKAGVKLIVRFAYTDVAYDPPEQPEPNDAPLSTVESDLAKLAPALRDNSDVILAVEAGFVGRWGEGTSSFYFGNIPNSAPALIKWDDRKVIVEKLLDIMPAGRKVLLRTPGMKQAMYDAADPDRLSATPAEVAANPDLGRIGYFNDCFLSGGRDADTYIDATDRTYVASETEFVPMGGETCNGESDDPLERARSDCPNALDELQRFNWSYLDRDYNIPEVLQKWIDQACMAKVENRLGYRFRLVSTRAAPTVKQGGILRFRMLMRNTGWAGTVNRRPVILVLLRQKAPHRRYRISLGTTANWKARRRWLRACKLPISPRLMRGEYNMFLSLPDPESTLNHKQIKRLFSIQLANVGVFDPATGLNDLKRTVTVLPQAAAARSDPIARRAAGPCTNQAG